MTDRFISPGTPPTEAQAELLITLGEECNEVAVRISKALRFGLDEVQPGQGLTNVARISGELRDVVTLVNVCIAAGIPFPVGYDAEAQLQKLDKLRRFFQIEENVALVEDMLRRRGVEDDD